MKQIPLTRGKFALVDDNDYERLMQWEWHYSRGYAYRKIYINKNEGKCISVGMHQEILNPKDGELVDHRNFDGLDNRKENIRICTKAQNSMNRKLQKNNTSGFKGVYFDKERCLFQAYIKINGKRKHLGRFADKIQAAMTYNRAAKEYFGEFAYLNEV